MNALKEKLEKETDTLKQEIKKRTLGYITAGLGLVAGLAWNEAIRGLIDYLFPFKKDSVSVKFGYAVLITAIVVFLGVYLAKVFEKEKKE